MKRVGLLVFPGFQILDLVAVSVFELANAAAQKGLYDIGLVSEQGGAVRGSSGVHVVLGVEVSRTVARKLVVYHRRAGGQSQFSALLELEPKSDRIQDALSYAKENLRRTLSVEQLAEVAHLSPRQFSRTFLAETGQSPARAIERLRVETARVLIEAGGYSIDRVAEQTGFSDPERMRRAFHRTFGQPPESFKGAARRQTAER